MHIGKYSFYTEYLTKMLFEVCDELDKGIYKEDSGFTTELLFLLTKNNPEARTKIRLALLSKQSINEIYEALATEQTMELQSACNLLRGHNLIGKGNYETAGTYLDDYPEPDAIKVVSIPFAQYGDNFIRNFLRLSTEHMRKKKELPNYVNILKKVFCTIGKNNIEREIKKYQFTEEECIENLPEIELALREENIEIDLSNGVINGFIKACREKYPLSKRSTDHLINNKKFKEEFINDFMNNLKETLETMFKEIIETVNKMYAQGNVVGPITSGYVNNTLVNLSYFLQEDFKNRNNLHALLFKKILSVYKEQHKKALKIKEEKKGIQTKKEGKGIDNNEEIINFTVVKEEEMKRNQPYRKTVLTKESLALLNAAIDYLNCDGKKRKKILRFITKSIYSGYPINFSKLQQIFNLEDIPYQFQNILIDRLGVEYEIDEPVTQNLERAVEKENKIQEEIAIQEIEITDEEVFPLLIKRMIDEGINIPNKKILLTQVTSFCQTTNGIKILKKMLKSEHFLKHFLHKGGHPNARAIMVGTTGRRFLFKLENDNLIFDSLSNHDNYLNRLEQI